MSTYLRALPRLLPVTLVLLLLLITACSQPTTPPAKTAAPTLSETSVPLAKVTLVSPHTEQPFSTEAGPDATRPPTTWVPPLSTSIPPTLPPFPTDFPSTRLPDPVRNTLFPTLPPASTPHAMAPPEPITMPAAEGPKTSEVYLSAHEDDGTTRSSTDDRGGPSHPYHHTGPSALKAGEIDDNDNWDDYLEFLQSYQGPPVHKLDVSKRHIITIRNADDQPVPDARVTVSSDNNTLFQGRTYADGRFIFFPRALHPTANTKSFTVRAQKNGSIAWASFPRNRRSDWELTLDIPRPYQQGIHLDILFLLDATGSMSDEINRIKQTLVSISQRVSDLPSQPDLRFGMVTYRDRGDDYVTQTYDFDHNVRRFTRAVRNVSADGGNDYPESLNEALHQAVNNVSWRDDNAVRLVFLLADAPPHLDYPQDYDYIQEAAEARRRGIKIFAVASSGLDSQGEYVFRQIAQQTMGKFIFILYETGPQGRLDTPHDVGDFTINRLDSLIVRLVQEELGELNQK